MDDCTRSQHDYRVFSIHRIKGKNVSHNQCINCGKVWEDVITEERYRFLKNFGYTNKGLEGIDYD